MATFQNVYYKRAVATAKPCYVCFKPTTTVLATLNATDFVYTCDLHLSDPGFASRVPEEPAIAKPAASTEEILKIKQEWEERQKRKEEKDKDKDKKEDKDKDDNDAKKKEKDKKSPAPSSTPSTPPAPATPKHEKYTLHRDMFAMRQAEHRKRRNAAQAKEVAPRIPSAPRSTID